MNSKISEVQAAAPEQNGDSVQSAQQGPAATAVVMDSGNEDKLLVEQFLMENYRFRRNELSGKVEFVVINQEVQEGLRVQESSRAQEVQESSRVQEVQESSRVQEVQEGSKAQEVQGFKKVQKFRALTDAAMNSVLRRVEMALPDVSNPKHHVEMFVFSEDIPVFNPAREIFRELPEWDGKNHIADFFNRIPGLSAEQLYWLSVWFRSVGAHWLEMDSEHGNECVPTLIGAQGCGKSTFLRRILPAELREYFLDHVNLSNKNDKEMALTNNLIVNLDEMDQIKPGQWAELKQMLSKVRVNGRPIYGRAQVDRTRYASFVATTNNPHPLNDPTGSRRYICISIPEGKLINNNDVIDYGQLYSQLYHELTVEKARYWFTNEEVIAIEDANQQFQAEMDICSIVINCFRYPKKDEVVKPLSVKDVEKIILKQYPLMKTGGSFNIRLGMTLRKLGFQLAANYSDNHHSNHYLIVEC